MKPKDYQKFAITKDREDAGYQHLIDESFTPSKARLINGALGLAGECGEVVDIIKKHTQYNKELDVKHLKEEIGDIMFYLAMILNDIDSSFEEILLNNQIKLDKRFPNGFTEANAIKRADKNE